MKMNNYIKKFNKITYLLIFLVVILMSGFGLPNYTLAVNLPDQEAEGLIVEFVPNPLFSENTFLPGDSQTGEVVVINNTVEMKKIAAEAINYPTSGILNTIPSDDLSRALTIIIQEKNGDDLYGGASATGEKTLFDFYKGGQIYLSDILVNETKKYKFKISFPLDKQNEWQEKTTRFDILVGFQGEEGQFEPTEQSGDSGGSLPSGLIIQYTEVLSITDTTVVINWFTSYNATSQVVFCRQSDSCFLDLNDNIGNPPLYGYEYTTLEIDTPANVNGVTYHEMVLTGLEPRITYEYRSISHASPPTISRKHEFTTLSVKAAEIKDLQESKKEQSEKEDLIHNETVGELIILDDGSVADTAYEMQYDNSLPVEMENLSTDNAKKNIPEIIKRNSNEAEIVVNKNSEEDRIENIVLDSKYRALHPWVMIILLFTFMFIFSIIFHKKIYNKSR